MVLVWVLFRASITVHIGLRCLEFLISFGLSRILIMAGCWTVIFCWMLGFCWWFISLIVSSSPNWCLVAIVIRICSKGTILGCIASPVIVGGLVSCTFFKSILGIVVHCIIIRILNLFYINIWPINFNLKEHWFSIFSFFTCESIGLITGFWMLETILMMLLIFFILLWTFWHVSSSYFKSYRLKSSFPVIFYIVW